MTRHPLHILSVCAFAIAFTACKPSEQTTTTTSAPQQTITIYSGRNEKLIAPLLERFKAQSGIDVSVRYGDTAELAATILEEGANTRAQLFISQDAAALGALASAGVLQPIPADVLERVAPVWRSPDGVWVGLSGRARTVVYDPSKRDPKTLPDSLEKVGDARYKGRFGIAPTNSSLQAHLAVYQAVKGEAATRALLASLVANEPRRYPNNSSIVDAVIAGEIDFGLVNHYYLWQARKERPDAPAENYFMTSGKASSFVNLAGIGLLDDSAAVLALARFLVSDEAQTYFAQETYEYPLVAGIAPPVDLLPLDAIETPTVDFGEVSKVLPSTLGLIHESGLIR
ncbi:MAG: extracellular solute-binding protein [Thermoanaerobaculia bacterium]